MLALLALVPRSVIFGAVGLAAGTALVTGTYLYGKHEGRQQAAVAAVSAVAKAYKDRSHENATVDALDRVALCKQLGGLPDDCAKLRGGGEDSSEAPIGGVPGH